MKNTPSEWSKQHDLAEITNLSLAILIMERLMRINELAAYLPQDNTKSDTTKECIQLISKTLARMMGENYLMEVINPATTAPINSEDIDALINIEGPSILRYLVACNNLGWLEFCSMMAKTKR